MAQTSGLILDLSLPFEPTSNMIKHFPRNEAGRDFAVGDIHGCYELLQQQMTACGFDAHRDRLFSVGDLIDRGPDSEGVADLLVEPWFHAVRGNHEAMAIDMLDTLPDRASYRLNGGKWFLDLPHWRQRELVDRFNALPIALDIETSRGLIGLLHAEMAGATWANFCAVLERAPSSQALSPKAWEDGVPHPPPHAQSRARQRLIDTALWSRNRILHGDRRVIPDLHALVVGHTPVPSVTALGNVYYIDTGAVFSRGPLTIVDLADLDHSRRTSA